MFGDAFGYITEKSKTAYKDVQMSQSEYLQQVNGFAVGLKTALGGNEQAAAELADKIITAEADVVAATGTSQEAVQNAFNGIMKSNYSMLDNLQLGITPTKEGMQEVIDKVNEWNKANGNATKYEIDNLADVQSALVDYIAMQGMAGYAAGEASETLQGSLVSTKAAWTDLITGLSDPDADIGQLIDNLLSSAMTLFENFKPVLERALKGIGELITKALPEVINLVPGILQQTLPTLVEAGAQLLQSLFQALIDNASMTIGVITQLITTIIDMVLINIDLFIDLVVQIMVAITDAVIIALPVLIEKLPDVLMKIGSAIMDNLSVLLDALIQATTMIIEMLVSGIISLASRFAEAAGPLIEQFKEGIVQKWEDIKTWFAEAVLQLIENIKEWFSNLPYKIGEAIGQVIGTLIEWNASVVTWIQTALPQLIKSIVDWFEQLPVNIALTLLKAIDKVIEWRNNLMAKGKEAAQGLITNIVNTLRDLPNKMIEIGKNIVQGLWNGIQNAKDAFVNNIHNFFSGIVDGAKEALGIASPSKEFKKIGQFCVAGFDEGIAGLADTSMVTRKIDASLAGIQSNTAGATGLGNFNQTINMYSRKQTPDELAREIRLESKYGLMRGVAIG